MALVIVILEEIFQITISSKDPYLALIPLCATSVVKCFNHEIHETHVSSLVDRFRSTLPFFKHSAGILFSLPDHIFEYVIRDRLCSHENEVG